MCGNTVKVKKLNPKAKLPTYGSMQAAGADLYACLDCDKIEIPAFGDIIIHTGLALQIPKQLVGLVYARSGLATKRGLAPSNKVGVVDSDYRGEILVALHNHTDKPQYIEDGERMAQIVFTPYVTAKLLESDTLDETERGVGGFGSTGKK